MALVIGYKLFGNFLFDPFTDVLMPSAYFHHTQGQKLIQLEK